MRARKCSRRVLGGARVAALIGSGCLAACTQVFYQPSRDTLSVPPDGAEDVVLPSADGTLLHGWFVPATNGAPRAIFVHFHGNAGNITTHVRQLAWVTRRGYDLFEFDYRGYGLSDGAPTPAGVNADAVAAIKYAQGKLRDARHVPLVLYGQSLGGAVLMRALADTGTAHVSGVIVEATFDSYQDVAAGVAWRTPLLPFGGLAYTVVSDEFSPAPYIERISPVPLLVIHCEEDPLIDPRFARAIYDLARPPKRFWLVPGCGHVEALTTGGGEYRDTLLRYVESLPAPD